MSRTPRQSETTPLINNEKRKKWPSLVTMAITVIIMLITADCLIRILSNPCNDPLDPDVRARIRKEWDLQLRQHDELARNHQEQGKTWKREEIAHIKHVEEWHQEHEAYQSEKKEREERWKREQMAHDKLVQEEQDRERKAYQSEKKEREERWKREQMAHDKLVQEEQEREREAYNLEKKERKETWKVEQSAHDELAEEWNREREAYISEKREREERWKREQRAHDELVREEWERERITHDREKMEREEREEDERRKLNMVWVGVKPHGCSTYATREYTARLANVPSHYNNRVEACKATPLVVHGQPYLPRTCQDNGRNGIIGTWNVNQSQPDCVTFWSDYKDKGCTSVGSRKRRIEHHLENLPLGGDWREFSATTPISFLDMQFPGAAEAFKSTWGVYGLWEIDDGEC